ncbi:MAG: O-antigen ligase family protein [Terriglobia bacterium]
MMKAGTQQEARSEAYTLHFTPYALHIARILLVAALFAAPLAFGAVQAWAWASLAALSCALLFLWSVGCVRQGALKIVGSPLYLPGVLFLLLGTIQLFAHLTLDPIATRESLLKLVTDLVFFFLAGQLLASGSPRILRAFGLAVVVYAFSLALFAILQFFSSNGLIFWTVAAPGAGIFGPYVNRNHYAGLMEMLIPLAAGYVLSRPRNHPLRSLLGFALLVPIASLLLTGSRGGFISLLAEVLILGAIFVWRAPVAGRRRLAAVGGLGLTAAALLFFWMDPGEISQRLETVASITHSPDVTMGGRLVAARDSLRIFRDHPFLGTGLGSFELAFPQYQSVPTDSTWQHAHNDYAEVLADTGLAGGLLVAVGLVMFFGMAFRKLGQRLRDDTGWIQLGAAIGCCGLLVHSFVDFNFHVPANAAWFAACVAIATVNVPHLPPQRATGAVRTESRN